jgi:hypothetical protein
MKGIVIVFVACLATGSMAMLDQNTKDMMNKFNLYSMCFGKEAAKKHYKSIMEACHYCMDVSTPNALFNEVDSLSGNEVEVLKGLLSNPALAQLIMASTNLRRNKREVDLNELKDNIQDHKMEMMTKIGNLTCVLTQMKVLTADGNINMDSFSYSALKAKKMENAGRDDDFVRAMETGLSDCNAISQSWPQKTLDRHPLMAAYGRQCVFFECMHKIKEKMCYQWCLYEGVKEMHGIDTGRVDLGIPGNKFDVATGVHMVMHENAPKEMRFVEKFFWGKSDMM